jgi:hypothetical protein
VLGKQPVDIALDQRIVQIYVGSYAVNPNVRIKSFGDLKSEMATLDFKRFLQRVRTRWPRVLNAGDLNTARQTLLDLVTRNIERLEAKLEAHLQHAEDYAASVAASLGVDNTPEGERLQRYEMASDRRLYRSLNGLWKCCRETKERAEDGRLRAEDGEEDFGEEIAVDLSAEMDVVGEATDVENENETTEAGVERR